jgi:hypothetical protein
MGVSVINPGFVETPLTAQNDFRMPALITPEEAATRSCAAGARASFEIHFPKRFTLWLKALRHLGYGPTSRPCAAPPGCVCRCPPPRPARGAHHRASSRRCRRPTCAAGELYAADARFKDPFNEVQGVPAIAASSPHVRTLDGPRFVVRDVVVQGDQCFLTWDFLFRMKRWRAPSSASAAARTCARPDGRIACTATTGTRPRSCTRSCPCWAR